MPLKYIDIDLANVSTDYFVDGATGDLSEGITLEETATPDGLAHQLSFVGSADISGAEFVVTGTDADDNPITETVTGVTTNPVETTAYFKTIASIESEDDISTATVDVGYVDEAVSETLPLNWRSESGVNVRVVVTGTINYDVEFTNDDLNSPRNKDQSDLPWFIADSDLDDETTSQYVQAPSGLTGARVKVNSYSSGARLQVYLSQPDRTRLSAD